MRTFVKAFWQPKAGNTEEEYEDAFYPEDGERNGKLLRLAVSDGASEGILSGEWAKILVKTFCKLKAHNLQTEWVLDEAYEAWDKWKSSYFHEREMRNKPIQWFEEPGLQAGAFSTLLGLTLEHFESEMSGKWRAFALGDTCLFQVRAERLLAKFPLRNSSGFDNRPFLISSNPARNNGIPKVARRTYGDWRVNDSFYLMTDALASWFLQETEAGQVPWHILRDFDTCDQKLPFPEWMDGLRRQKRIRNDDVTLVRVDIT